MSLANYWYIACESRELNGKPILRMIFGQALVLFRDETGNPVALQDRCAHRNMALSLGKVVNGCIECPYHGWQYDRTGECTHVPSLAEDRAAPGSTHIPTYHALEQDNYVWVYCSPKTPDGKPF